MVAPLVIGALVGAGLGAAKQKEQMKAAQQNRQLQATIASQSPWTSMQADTSNLGDPSMLGNVSQGALSGASFGMQDAFKGGGEPGGAPTPDSGSPGVSEEGPSAYAMTGGQNPNGQGPLMDYQNTQAPQSQSMAMLGGGQSPWMQMGGGGDVDPATGKPYKNQTMIAGQ